MKYLVVYHMLQYMDLPVRGRPVLVSWQFWISDGINRFWWGIVCQTVCYSEH